MHIFDIIKKFDYHFTQELQMTLTTSDSEETQYIGYHCIGPSFRKIYTDENTSLIINLLQKEAHTHLVWQLNFSDRQAIVIHNIPLYVSDISVEHEFKLAYCAMNYNMPPYSDFLDEWYAHKRAEVRSQKLDTMISRLL